MYVDDHLEPKLSEIQHYGSFTPNNLPPTSNRTVGFGCKNWVRHPLLPTVFSQSDRIVGSKLFGVNKPLSRIVFEQINLNLILNLNLNK